ncbi:hydroxyalkanoic acid synthase [Alkalihalophilus pseudofirmus]|nr:hydroxyalkanoic acid synthase [Alkalihalophilus pseudofirmus]
MVDPDLLIGQTPRKLVWRKNKTTLWYYPTREKKYQTPLFLIYSLINKSYILDLYPGMSMIEAFLKEGYDVYLLDFGEPGYEDKNLTLDDYILKYIDKGVKRALLHANVEEMSIIGYCLGGTLTAIYVAIASAPIKNVVLFAAPIDFENFHNHWKESLKDKDMNRNIHDIIDEYGIIPGKVVEGALRLVTSPFSYSSYLYPLQKLADETAILKWRLLNKWLKDPVPFPGATLKQLIEDLGISNKLVNNKLVIDGKKVDLTNIEANTLVIATTDDQIVPEHLTKPIMELISSNDKTFARIKGGHVSIAMTGKIPEVLQEWLSQRSNQLKN